MQGNRTGRDRGGESPGRGSRERVYLAQQGRNVVADVDLVVADSARCDEGDNVTAVDGDGVAHREVCTDRICTGRAGKRGRAGIKYRRGGLVALRRAAGRTVGERRRRRSKHQRIMSGAERSRLNQLRSRYGRVVCGRQRIPGQVGAIIDLGGLLRRQEVVLEFENLRRTARGAAGGRVDRNAFEIIACAVYEIASRVARTASEKKAGACDEIACLVELEAAAARVAVDTVEPRHAVGEGAGLLHR